MPSFQRHETLSGVSRLSNPKPSNIPASVRQRLLNLSRERGEDFNLILTRYAVERLLYRLSVSPYANQFVLKGAMLLNIWTGYSYRPTRDLDLLGFGDSSAEWLASVFREICQIQVEPDGMGFDPESVRIEEIQQDQEYQGQRIWLKGFLSKAEIPIQVDVGFGDVITPEAKEIIYPAILDFEPPQIRAYARETVVAEKLQAIVVLGMANSRMKDYYDLSILSRQFSFAGSDLAKAITATFNRRNTAIPDKIPTGLSDAFSTDIEKVTQWKAYLKRNALMDASEDLVQIITELRGFLLPPLQASNREAEFRKQWTAGGSWA